MIIQVHRLWYSKTATFGVMTVDGTLPCYTLEETELQIPAGTYEVELTYSPKFHRLLPLLLVPHRPNIRIHAGNWPRDSSGCILVGLSRGQDMIGHSRLALDPLVTQLQQALAAHAVVRLSIS